MKGFNTKEYLFNRLQNIKINFIMNSNQNVSIQILNENKDFSFKVKNFN